MVASASSDALVKIWRASDGAILQVYRVVPRGTRYNMLREGNLAFTRDGSYVVAIPSVGGCMLLATQTHDRIVGGDMTEGSGISSSRNGKRILFATGSLHWLWDLDSNRIGDVDIEGTSRFIGAGDTIMSVIGDSVLWRDGRTLEIIRRQHFVGGSVTTGYRALSPDGRLFLVVDLGLRRLTILEIATGATVDSLTVGLEGMGAEFTADSKGVLVSALGGRIGFLRMRGESSTTTLSRWTSGRSHGTGGLAGGNIDDWQYFGSPGGGLVRMYFGDTVATDTLTSHNAKIDRLLSLSGDSTLVSASGGVWRFFDARSGEGHARSLWTNLNSYATDRGLLAVYRFNATTIGIIEVTRGDTLAVIETPGEFRALSRDGEIGLFVDGRIGILRNLRDGGEISRIEAVWTPSFETAFSPALLSHSGQYIVTRLGHNREFVVLRPDGRIDTIPGSQYDWLMTFSNDERVIYFVRGGNTVIEWQIDQTRLRELPIGHEVDRIEVAGDDQIVTLNADSTISVWSRDLELRTRVDNLQDGVWKIATSRNGEWVGLGLVDGSIAVLDIDDPGKVLPARPPFMNEELRELSARGRRVSFLPPIAGEIEVSVVDLSGRVIAREVMRASPEVRVELYVPASTDVQPVVVVASWRGGWRSGKVVVGVPSR